MHSAVGEISAEEVLDPMANLGAFVRQAAQPMCMHEGRTCSWCDAQCVSRRVPVENGFAALNTLVIEVYEHSEFGGCTSG